MTVRVRTKIEIVAALNSDETEVQFSRPDSTLSQVTEEFDVSSSGAVELTAAEADHELPMGDVAGGRVLYVEVDGKCTIKLDGEATGHTLGDPATGYKAKLFLRSEFSSAPLITNESATAVVNVAYLIAGTK